MQEAHEDKIESLCITYTATRIGSYASKLVFVAMLTPPSIQVYQVGTGSGIAGTSGGHSEPDNAGDGEAVETSG